MEHNAGTAHEDGTSGSQRLQSMRLPSVASGWVPEPVLEPALPSSAPRAETARPPVQPTLGGVARDWLQDRLPPWAHRWLERVSLGSVFTGLSVLVGIVLVGVLLLHRHSGGGDPTYDASVTSTGSGSSSYAVPTAPAAPATATDPASIVVDVGGKVRKPGLVTLPAGARVADAITAAGGPLRHREVAKLDLAARVTDGQLLLIGAPSWASADASAGPDDGAPSSSAPVDLNSATLEELETLPGIGPVTGQKIIDWRTAHSGFTSIEQLQQVSGIGPATYADLAPLVAP